MSATTPHPRRGEIWYGRLDPTEGREQGGDRPLLVVSDDRFNASGRELVAVTPLTSVRRGFVWHVDLDPPEGGVARPSAIMVEQVRTISIRRLGGALAASGRQRWPRWSGARGSCSAYDADPAFLQGDVHPAR